MIDYIMRIIFGMDLVLYTQSKNKNIIVMIARKNSLCEKCKNKKIHKKHSIISFKELSLFLKNFYSK